MLGCNEAMTLLSNFLSNRLPPDRAEQVLAHLNGCKSCPDVANMCGVWVLEKRTPRRRAGRKPAKSAA